MKSLSSLWLLMIVSLVGLSSCEVVGGIFKAGMWTSVILIVIVVAIVLWLLGRMRR